MFKRIRRPYMWAINDELYGVVFSNKYHDNARIHFFKPRSNDGYCGWCPDRNRFYCGRNLNKIKNFRGTWRYTQYGW